MAYIREGSLQDRRKRPDGAIKAINILTILCYVLAALGIYFFVKGSPSMDGMISTFASTTFERASAVSLSQYDITWMNRLLFTLIVIAAFSGVGLLLNSTRIKRKRENYSFNLIFFFGTSLLLSLIITFNIIL